MLLLRLDPGVYSNARTDRQESNKGELYSTHLFRAGLLHVAQQTPVQQTLSATPVAHLFHIYPHLTALLALPPRTLSLGLPHRLSQQALDLDGLPEGVELGKIGGPPDSALAEILTVQELARRCLEVCGSEVGLA